MLPFLSVKYSSAGANGSIEDKQAQKWCKFAEMYNTNMRWTFSTKEWKFETMERKSSKQSQKMGYKNITLCKFERPERNLKQWLA